MELRYQRDLYRVQLCCDTKKEEKELGYPLQMCLRNTIRGLLPCQIQGDGGHTSVCWDVTSRHSISRMVGDGQLETAMLKKILEGLKCTMEELERYLIPCEYLVPDPDCMFLTADTGEIGFLCDFENMQSFRETLPVLGEYVLAHMDHRDTEAMRLGYGLYKLTVEETFDKQALAQLCESAQSAERMPQKQETNRYEADNIWQQSPVQQPGQVLKREAAAKKEEQRKYILEDFFSEDDEEVEQKLPFKPVMLCGIAILVGILLMEGIVFFRNGCHIQVVWIAAGVVIFIISASIIAVLQWFSVKKGKKDTDRDEMRQRKRQSYVPLEERKQVDKEAVHRTVYEELPERPERGGEQKTGAQVKHRVPVDDGLPCYKTYSNFAQKTKTEPDMVSEEMETVVLGHRMTAEPEAILVFPDETKYSLQGRHWLIGKSREAEICLQKPTVSRLHACILKKDDRYYIEDLNSKNGTYIDAVSLEPGQLYPLKAGQKLCFADQCCVFQQGED